MKKILLVVVFIVLSILAVRLILKTQSYSVSEVFSDFPQSSRVFNSVSSTTITAIVPKKGSAVDAPEKGIKQLYGTKNGGRTWQSAWDGGTQRALRSGQKDPLDPEFVARGNGVVSIDGRGVAQIKGDTPRMYVYDSSSTKKKWNDIEVTIYAKRVSETEQKSSQGIVIGARSEHQDAGESPCAGRTYYARMLYDGRVVFQKELIHSDIYSSNQPGENHKVDWGTVDRKMPKNVWIGMKFVVKTRDDGRAVDLKIFRDLTDGKDGGAWEKVAEYADEGNWPQIHKNIDVQKRCGFSAKQILTEPATSVFVRNDAISNMQYKLFSIREIK
ncbi:MAG: hypothetical protein EXS68_00815 [Candidatus Ryanbacteria bacterium]|nr:hypothetical protein [Candidatus Ryanbacteria bacterium]